MSSPEDEEAMLSQYSMPSMPGSSSSQSLLTQSQYAKVIFHDLLSVYPTDADIWCRYTVTDGVTIRHGDRIALYCVGWTSVHEHVQFEMAPVPSDEQKDKRKEDSEFQVLFKACNLPKDTAEFYQLCYVNVESCVCGASVPFQFRRPADDELCEVEEQEGMLVVRSRTAITETRLRDATSLIDELDRQRASQQYVIERLEGEVKRLQSRLEELAHIEKHEERLQEDIQALDTEKSLLSVRLSGSEQRIAQLNATIDALNADKVNLSALLKAECSRQRADNNMAAQLDNMQQMLDACSQSKEMAAQALHCEQSKVMRLNIEHDKFKYRCGCLEDENVALMTEVARWQTSAMELKAQVEDNLATLQAKADSHAALGQMLEQRAVEHHELAKQLRDTRAKLSEREDQITQLSTGLERAELDVKMAREEVDSLRASVASLTTSLRPEREQLRAAQAAIAEHESIINHMKRENDMLTRLAKPVHRPKFEEMQPFSPRANVPIEPPQAEASGDQRPSPLAQLKTMLAAAEECHSTLKTELGVAGARFESPRLSALDRAKAGVELKLAESNTRQQEHRHRRNQIARRLAELDTESERARTEREELNAQYLAEVNDLQFLHQRMETLQEQVLREDETQGMERESEEVSRLERMSKRAFELEQYVVRSCAALHDATQIALVLDAERASHQADAAALEQGLEAEAEVKTALLGKLVDIDRQAVEAREEEEARRKAESKSTMTVDELLRVCPEGDFEGFSMMMDASGTTLATASSASVPEAGDRNHGNARQDEIDAQKKNIKEALERGIQGAGEAELQLRLELAAVEYRKVYIEKLKAEKKLARMQKKCSNSSISSETSVTELHPDNPAKEFVCPICARTFPLTEPEPFTRHFEDHLS